MKADPSVSHDAEWLRQFDVSLPGCTLKKQVDILALIKQVSFLRIFICFFECITFLLKFSHFSRNAKSKKIDLLSTVT